MEAYLFYNGAIVTMAKDGDRPECLVTRGGRIGFTGRLEDARQWAVSQGLEPVDINLAGAAITPGFIDAHLHPLPMIFFAASADLEGATGLADIGRRLVQQAERVDPPEWVVGVQFQSKTLPPGEQLTRRELDALFPDRAVLIYARDGHCVIANTHLLEAAGIGPDVQSPQGGEIGRYADGALSGAFYEKAVGVPLAHMPAPSLERIVGASQALFDGLARNGITSIGAMLQSDEEGPGGAAASIESLAVQALRENIAQSIYAIVIGKTLDGINALIQSPLNAPDSRAKTRAFKIFADGTFGSCTACMSEPYADKACTHGYMVHDEDEIYRRMRLAHLAGFQVCIHAIGDQGIATCVRLFERLLAEHPKPDHRHRIEHASIASRDMAARIAGLGLQVCTQPLFIRSEKDWLPARLGADRSGMAYPFRGYFDAGIAVAGSSDAPIEAPDVIAAIDYAVNRGGFHPEQGLTPEEALAMFTRNAAFIQFEEAEKGTLEAGKAADIVVLDRDPLAVPASKLSDLKVLNTMIGGAFV
ncbi:MAG: amidohydrolase [Oceanicaulis sp.]|nr:amidohydrolase [Oceanicaulis sp.]